MVRFSRCCNPVPGDEIVGYITRGRGVSVHRKDCPNLSDSTESADRLIDVEWDTSKPLAFQAEIQIRAADRKGLLSEITKILSDSKNTVNALNARTNKERVAILNLTIEINDIEELDRLMQKFRNLKGILDVYRVIT
jgi:GTP pyrophosphokinase